MKLIENICKELGLPKGDHFTQDWVYELPEEFYTKKWLKEYISAYSKGKFNDAEKI